FADKLDVGADAKQRGKFLEIDTCRPGAGDDIAEIGKLPHQPGYRLDCEIEALALNQATNGQDHALTLHAPIVWKRSVAARECSRRRNVDPGIYDAYWYLGSDGRFDEAGRAA